MVGPAKDINGFFKKSQKQYWYRQGVVNQIIELYSDYKIEHEYGSELINPLYLPELIRNNGVGLFCSAIQFFGGWRNALKFAGLDDLVYTELSRLSSGFWTAETVMEQVMLLFIHRFDLSAGFIRRVYPELYFAAKDKELFGSWSNLLNEAEIDYSYLRSRSSRFWNPKKNLATIIDYEDAYGNIQPDFIRYMNPSLYSSTNQYISGWLEAVQKAGLNLTKNLIKVYLEPFRDYLIGEYLKKIFNILKLNSKELNFETQQSDLDEDPKNSIVSADIPKFHLVLGDGKSLHYIVPKYRSWFIEPEINDIITKNINMYTKIIFYHSIGEPRAWYDDRVAFENINSFYPELISQGRDDLVSELALITRGGVTKQYQDQFEGLMVKIRKILNK